MGNDLKFVESVNGMLSGQTFPNPDYVSGQYALVQKIFKCLLTNSGEDVFDPTYGSGIRKSLESIPGQDVTAASTAASACLKFVVSSLTDSSVTDPAEQLLALSLLSISYDPVSTSWILEVQVTSGTSTFTITTNT